LRSHKRYVHSNIRPYHCPYCGKRFATTSLLNLHVLRTRAKPYSCRHCSECFGRPDQLKTHLLKSHNEGTWLVCNTYE